MREIYDTAAKREALATAAVVGGAAALLVGLWLRLKPRIADEDSPIIIKSGSLTVARHDGYGFALSGSDKAYTLTSQGIANKSWIVTVAQLEAGFPVSGRQQIRDVTDVVLYLQEDDGTSLDQIRVTYERGSGGLTFTAANDSRFGSDVRNRSVNKSHKHKKRAFHRKVNNKDDFEIAKVTVSSSTGQPETFPQGGKPFDLVLAFDFV